MTTVSIGGAGYYYHPVVILSHWTGLEIERHQTGCDRGHASEYLSSPMSPCRLRVRAWLLLHAKMACAFGYSINADCVVGRFLARQRRAVAEYLQSRCS